MAQRRRDGLRFGVCFSIYLSPPPFSFFGVLYRFKKMYKHLKKLADFYVKFP